VSRASLGRKLLSLYVQPRGLGIKIPSRIQGHLGQIPSRGLGEKAPEAEDKCACELHVYIFKWVGKIRKNV